MLSFHAPRLRSSPVVVVLLSCRQRSVLLPFRCTLCAFRRVEFDLVVSRVGWLGKKRRRKKGKKKSCFETIPRVTEKVCVPLYSRLTRTCLYSYVLLACYVSGVCAKPWVGGPHGYYGFSHHHRCHRAVIQ